jgi:hypothetical protein
VADWDELQGPVPILGDAKTSAGVAHISPHDDVCDAVCTGGLMARPE